MPAQSPQKIANQLSQMLTTVLGQERFPVNVEELIFEYSKNFPDPVTKIRKVSLDGFEGMLRPSNKRAEWHILYNEAPEYVGRERFTLAHEFSHYLLDREPLVKALHERTRSNASNEFQCNPLNQHTWDEEEKMREQNADTFASYLLMPIDDFRQQVDKQPLNLELFRHIIDRYGVSLTASLLKWIEFTDQLAAMIVSRDGFALWGRASSTALKEGVFIRSGMEIPEASHASTTRDSDGVLKSIAPHVWSFTNRAYASHEMSIYSPKIEKTLTILLFDRNDASYPEIEQTFDSFDHFTKMNSR